MAQHGTLKPADDITPNSDGVDGEYERSLHRAHNDRFSLLADDSQNALIIDTKVPPSPIEGGRPAHDVLLYCGHYRTVIDLSAEQPMLAQQARDHVMGGAPLRFYLDTQCSDVTPLMPGGGPVAFRGPRIR